MNNGNNDLINDKNEEKGEEIDNKELKKENKIDINSLKVDELKNELKKRNIDIPKNAKKKDLQELLINSDK
jgi:hypothetical protein